MKCMTVAAKGSMGAALPFGGTGRALAAALLLASASLSAGCATRPDGSTVTIVDDVSLMTMSNDGLNEAERRQLDRAKRYAEMRATGAGVGAVTGAIVGFLTGDIEGAVIGGVGGGALGYLGGAYVANLNSVAEDRRDDLNAQLAAANKAVEENRAAVRDNRSIVSAETRRIDRLNNQYRAGQITAAQYADEIETLNKKVRIVEESLRAAEDDVSGVRATASARRERGDANGASQLEARADTLQSEVRRLEAERIKLVEAVATIPPAAGGPSV